MEIEWIETKWSVETHCYCYCYLSLDTDLSSHWYTDWTGVHYCTQHTQNSRSSLSRCSLIAHSSSRISSHIENACSVVVWIGNCSRISKCSWDYCGIERDWKCGSTLCFSRRNVAQSEQTSSLPRQQHSLCGVSFIEKVPNCGSDQTLHSSRITLTW